MGLLPGHVPPVFSSVVVKAGPLVVLHPVPTQNRTRVQFKKTSGCVKEEKS